MNVLIIISAVYFFYVLVIYPIALFVLGINKEIKVAGEILQVNSNNLPKITFLVTAHQAESIIEEKILNSLELNYPKENIEYIFVVDGSSDATYEIICKYPRILCINIMEHIGKEPCIKKAIAIASGEIVVFSDVNTHVNKDSLRIVSRCFEDKRVGAVSSVDEVVGGNSIIDTCFIAFEMLLRKLEARIYSTTGLSGSFFAARKDLCAELDDSGCSDFQIALICIRKNYRALIEDSLVGKYRKSKNIIEELPRKQRTIVHGILTLANNRDLLNPINYPLISWQLFSHKILRWTFPVFAGLLILGFISSFFEVELLTSNKYILASVLSVSIVFFILRRPQINRNIKYIFLCNIAVMSACLDIIKSNKHIKWNSTKR